MPAMQCGAEKSERNGTYTVLPNLRSTVDEQNRERMDIEKHGVIQSGHGGKERNMKYRKKPVVIEAYQTDKELDIETLEGTMHASVGDYIITGVRGEKYPCKPDIFEQTYEPADATAASPWHRVEDELPEMREIAPGHVRSETLVLYDAETGYMDTGYVRDKPDNNGVDWFWGLPRKTPTHWIPMQPPKEDA